jgi:DNA repair protein RadA/Sms
VVFGEVGLSGETRAVSQTETRLKEAAKLGFTSAVLPLRAKADRRLPSTPLALKEISALAQLVALFDEAGPARPGPDARPRRHPGNRPANRGTGGR